MWTFPSLFALRSSSRADCKLITVLSSWAFAAISSLYFRCMSLYPCSAEPYLWGKQHDKTHYISFYLKARWIQGPALPRRSHCTHLLQICVRLLVLGCRVGFVLQLFIQLRDLSRNRKFVLLSSFTKTHVWSFTLPVMLENALWKVLRQFSTLNFFHWSCKTGVFCVLDESCTRRQIAPWIKAVVWPPCWPVSRVAWCVRWCVDWRRRSACACWSPPAAAPPLPVTSSPSSFADPPPARTCAASEMFLQGVSAPFFQFKSARMYFSLWCKLWSWPSGKTERFSQHTSFWSCFASAMLRSNSIRSRFKVFSSVDIRSMSLNWALQTTRKEVNTFAAMIRESPLPLFRTVLFTASTFWNGLISPGNWTCVIVSQRAWTLTCIVVLLALCWFAPFGVPPPDEQVSWPHHWTAKRNLKSVNFFQKEKFVSVCSPFTQPIFRKKRTYNSMRSCVVCHGAGCLQKKTTRNPAVNTRSKLWNSTPSLWGTTFWHSMSGRFSAFHSFRHKGASRRRRSLATLSSCLWCRETTGGRAECHDASWWQIGVGHQGVAFYVLPNVRQFFFFFFWNCETGDNDNGNASCPALSSTAETCGFISFFLEVRRKPSHTTLWK